MKETLKERLMQEYPDYHEKPLRLTIQEIESPRTVLEDVFTSYDLPTLRACLKEMLDDSLSADDVYARDHLLAFDYLERLIEASWLIHSEISPNETQTDNGQTGVAAERQLLEFEDPRNIYSGINAFFDSITVKAASKYILSAIKATESQKVWNKKSPVNLVHFFDTLEKLVVTVFKISKNPRNPNAVIKPSPWYVPDITKTEQYCLAPNDEQAWDCIPRHLRILEFHNPYMVIDKVTGTYSLKEWKQLLHSILSYALSAHSNEAFGIEMETVKIGELLFKLVEACHLINVRIKPYRQ